MVSNKMKVRKLESKTSLDYKEFLIFLRDSKAGGPRARARENCLPRGNATRGGKKFSRLPTWYVRSLYYSYEK